MSNPDYPSLLNKLDHLLTNPVVQVRWPQELSLRLDDALATLCDGNDAEELARHVATTQAQVAMLTHPVIAVLGQLNAGKSSVVSTFLSSAARPRVPRGVDDNKGTHRFVYWVPDSWLADSAKKEAFFTLLDAVHGHQCEFLREDPKEAEEQYRSGRGNLEKLKIPLIASDPGLDAIGAALLDCPDIQTYDGTGTPAAVENHRLEMLVQAAQICSAFLVVWQRAQVGDGLLRRLFSDLRTRLGTAPLFLLLNKIDPEQGQPTCSRNDSNVKALLTEYTIEENAVYGAFHFRVEPGWRESTPPDLVEGFNDAQEELPQFFQLATDEAGNIPANIAPERFLTRLPDRLESTDLQRRKMADAWASLGEIACGHIVALRKEQKAQRQSVEEMHKGLLGLCVELMTDAATGDARVVLSEEFTKAHEDSINRTAPTLVRTAKKFAKPIIWIGEQMKVGASKLGETIRAIGRLRNGELLIDDIREKVTDAFSSDFAGQDLGLALTDADSLASDMTTRRWVPAKISKEELRKGWEKAFENLRDHPPEVDIEGLDRMNEEFWKTMKFSDQLKFSAREFLAVIGSLVLIAGALVAIVDYGMTTITLNALIPASIAGGGGGLILAGLWAKATEVNTLPYLSRLFAFAADAFGLPRKLSSEPIEVLFGKGNERRPYRLPDFTNSKPEVVCSLGDVRLWEESPELREIEDLFKP